MEENASSCDDSITGKRRRKHASNVPACQWAPWRIGVRLTSLEVLKKLAESRCLRPMRIKEGRVVPCWGQHGLAQSRERAQSEEALFLRRKQRSRAHAWCSGFLECYPRDWHLSHLTQGPEGENTNFGKKGQWGNLLTLSQRTFSTVNREQRKPEISSSWKWNWQASLVVKM